MRRVLAVLAAWALIAGSGSAQAWGAQGHALIGAIADQLLQAGAARQVKGILGLPLRVAATWADCVKDVAKDAQGFVYTPDPRHRLACQAFETERAQARMVDYVRRNWSNCPGSGQLGACHKAYHFTDVAIQRDRYQRGLVGTKDHDIVGVLEAAIDVLQGRSAPAPFSIRDKAEALLLLAHFVGDVHQPLHVGAVYLDAQGHAVDPDASGHPIDPDTATRGGNSIEDGATDLHSTWDTIPAGLAQAPPGAPLLAAARRIAVNADDVARWPAAWAGETVTLARAAFGGLSFAPRDPLSGRWSARVADRDAYLQMKDALQTEQLTKAGARLAQLLNAIWP